MKEDILDLVSTNAGVPLRLLQTAVGYWARHPEEIDAEIAAAEAANAAAEAAWQRRHDLLGP
ncbi:MAG: hypothetical protein ACYDH5_09970 [Acidimicrobiales bacterium]